MYGTTKSNATSIAAARAIAAAYFDRPPSRGEPPSEERDLFVAFVAERAGELDGAGPLEQDSILAGLYRRHLEQSGVVSA